MDEDSVERPRKGFRVSWWLIGIAGTAVFITVAYLAAGPLQMPYRELFFAPLALAGAIVTFVLGVWKSPAVRPAARLAHGAGWMAVWVMFLILPIGIRAGVFYKKVCDLPVPPGTTRFAREIDWWNSPAGNRYRVWAILPADNPRSDIAVAEFCRRSLESQGWREFPGLSLRELGVLTATFRRAGELLTRSTSYYDDGTMLVVLNVEDIPRDGEAAW